jgi:hypothetical protein
MSRPSERRNRAGRASTRPAELRTRPQTIAGAWEICHDGKTWERDFDLTYTKER